MIPYKKELTTRQTIWSKAGQKAAFSIMPKGDWQRLGWEALAKRKDLKPFNTDFTNPLKTAFRTEMQKVHG